LTALLEASGRLLPASLAPPPEVDEVALQLDVGVPASVVTLGVVEAS
jgi:hypothetical protein